MLKFKQLNSCLPAGFSANVQFQDLKVLLLRGVINYDLLLTLHSIDETAEVGRLWSHSTEKGLCLETLCPSHLSDLTTSQKVAFYIIDFINLKPTYSDSTTTISSTSAPLASSSQEDSDTTLPDSHFPIQKLLPADNHSSTLISTGFEPIHELSTKVNLYKQGNDQIIWNEWISCQRTEFPTQGEALATCPPGAFSSIPDLFADEENFLF